jgi:glutamate dehydrogenase (NAD(P)+)
MMNYTNMKSDDFYSKLQQMQSQFDQMEPELAITVSDLDQGVEGYIVVWNTAISEGGPLEYSGKGGTRISPTVNLEEVKMLARSAALKNAAAGLAMGWAKS